MAVDTRKCEAAKQDLRQALAACGGNTKDKHVIDAIENLQTLNPTIAPTRSGTLVDSNWLLISAPNFPGGELLADGSFAYTLGRLAFNMFQPRDSNYPSSECYNLYFCWAMENSAATILLWNLRQLTSHFPH